MRLVWPNKWKGEKLRWTERKARKQKRTVRRNKFLTPGPYWRLFSKRLGERPPIVFDVPMKSNIGSESQAFVRKNESLTRKFRRTAGPVPAVAAMILYYSAR